MKKEDPNLFTIQELVSNNEIMSHLFLECVPSGTLKKIAEDAGDWEKNKYSVKIQLLVEGKPIDTRPFFKLFYDQYSNMVEKKAKQILAERSVEKLEEVMNKVQEFSQMIQYCIDDIDYKVENIFKNE